MYTYNYVYNNVFKQLIIDNKLIDRSTTKKCFVFFFLVQREYLYMHDGANLHFLRWHLKKNYQ